MTISMSERLACSTSIVLMEIKNESSSQNTSNQQICSFEILKVKFSCRLFQIIIIIIMFIRSYTNYKISCLNVKRIKLQLHRTRTLLV